MSLIQTVEQIKAMYLERSDCLDASSYEVDDLCDEIIRLRAENEQLVTWERTSHAYVERDKALAELAAVKAELEKTKADVSAQSELIQHEWASPYELAGLKSELEKLLMLVEFITRMKSHSQNQIRVSGNSPAWIGYHNAMKDCVDELQRLGQQPTQGIRYERRS
jgi:chromosome segregation ATPase